MPNPSHNLVRLMLFGNCAGGLWQSEADGSPAETEIRRTHELEIAYVGSTVLARNVVSSATSGMMVAAENTIDQAGLETAFPEA